MALGALVTAIDDSEDGGLCALLPVAGRPLVELQLRAVGAAGASPIVVLVDEPPAGLTGLLDRLRGEGLNIVTAEDAAEVAARFEADALVIQVADGIVPDLAQLQALAEAGTPQIITVPDEDAHERFERIDLTRRWAGLSLVEGRDIGGTAAMLGEWDLSSTLLRRSVQAGAELVAGEQGEGRGPLLVETPADAADYSRRMLAASKGERRDWVARYVTPWLEDFLTEKLSASGIRPVWIALAGLMLGALAIPAFLLGYGLVAVAALLLSMPLDLVARRIASLRLRALGPKDWRFALRWPLVGTAFLAFGWWLFASAGWGAMMAALSLVVFAEVLRPLRKGARFETWLFARRPAILVLLPFGLFGQWLLGLLVLTAYAGGSLILAQRLRAA
ncbi:glycosyltransferase family protein [Sphingomicrobium marinum]|uniref:hypothetical protein n=1 Tax=Sphingomicrobium marinum TaxID=1227950 RepID=UPI0022408C9A|nr:hypothetical protein [Sphingomicrobium marinum]